MHERFDRSSFAEWYAQAAPGVLRRVAAAVGDEVLAREACAEAFARAYERWRRVQQLDAPEAWVVTVARNLCRRSWRRRALEQRALARLGAMRVESTESTETSGSTGSSGSFRSFGANGDDDDDDVRAAVERLPDRMRTAVQLRYWADLPEHEVARRMDVAPGTVSALLSQARRRLGERLANPPRLHG